MYYLAPFNRCRTFSELTYRFTKPNIDDSDVTQLSVPFGQHPTTGQGWVNVPDDLIIPLNRRAIQRLRNNEFSQRLNSLYTVAERQQKRSLIQDAIEGEQFYLKDLLPDKLPTRTYEQMIEEGYFSNVP